MRTRRRQAGLQGLPGWDRLRHGGLLLDPKRLAAIAGGAPDPLDDHTERQLRQRASSMLDGDGDPSAFTTFVLERVCGLDSSTGVWMRGTSVAPSWGRRAITGETVKPRQLWTGPDGGRLPVFLDRSGKRLGIGRSRRTVSQMLGWLRAGNDHLALVTNGRQWRLLFAGLDFDAWCEWDLELWFEHGELAPQVTALRTLLSPKLWTPESEDADAPLLQAIRDTRKGQAELSEVLGERVREAVELLIQGHGEALKEQCGDVDPADIYRAACRVAMRLVVILFAESRELLPRDNSLYHESYGLNGLLEQLERAATRTGALAGRLGAWPRVLALFRLVRDGSHHPDLPVTAYGGDLFAPGWRDAAEGLSRALSVFESACFQTESRVLPDRDVYEMLKLLTRTTMRIRQGRGGTRIVVPVDFSDLSSEYIGILYEGLLDYELKTAPSGDPVIFLSVGDQPALPLSRLEAMDDRALKALFESLKKSGSTAVDDASSRADQKQRSQQKTEDQPQPPATENDGPEPTGGPDIRQENRTRAEVWARRAALAAGLVRKPRGRDTPERRLAFESRLGAKARQLVGRIVLPGEWYLVRWGGTRKGSGSFYTRPGLAVPTVQRTLRPLAYDPPGGTDGKPDPDAPTPKWTPRLPEQILALKVCDPACGSGTFPLAALRFLTEALYASLQHHGRIEPDGERALVRLLGIGGEHPETSHGPRLDDELIPCPPEDEHFESRLKAVLHRHVVERCIYAVDLDPLAVELCRLSLWIETMDRNLPFGFLDHKIKCGNALIGAWFDQFRHYPVMAWKNREGGDKNHNNGVHFQKNARTRRIKDFVKGKLTPDLRDLLDGRPLYQADLLAKSVAAHKDAFAVLSRMHAMPVQDTAERARHYREHFLGSPSWRSLKHAMDLWCACWFWPAEEIENAPLPSTFAEPEEETRAVADRIAAEMRFLHWEWEFPDVFHRERTGFDAILGNPPWDIAKPISKEFFSNLDPLYRSYGKQVAIRKQSDYFADAELERDWLEYNARFRAQSNYMSRSASPFGDPEENSKSQNRFLVVRGNRNRTLHTRWRTARRRATGFVDPSHPYRHQGSADLNLYKLFLEAGHALLRSGGRLGFIVPSGLYSDNGTQVLRRLFLERCSWEWLFGIENRDKVFPIHRSYKFNPVIVEKGGSTETIRTTFMRRDLDDWERAEELTTFYSRAQVERFSPNSRAILEIQSKRDLEILEKIYANSVLLGDDGPDGWGIKYATEFHMTNDSKLFPPRPQWESKGYRPDEYSRWLLGDWRPIEELWAELGVDPSRPEPAEIELEDWLFDTTVGPERREAEARFIHGHLLKPGDVARTDWHLRCAQRPYDRLLIPRANVPPGLILSRDGDAWIQETNIQDVAVPVYQGIMLQPFMPSAQSWISGTGLRARWMSNEFQGLAWNPQFLMSQDTAEQEQISDHVKIGYRRVARNTDARTFIAAILPPFPCGDAVFLLHLENSTIYRVANAVGLFNSYVFDWFIRQRLVATNLNWSILSDGILPLSRAVADLFPIVRKLNLFPRVFSAVRAPHTPQTHYALNPGERVRLRSTLDAISCAVYGCDTADVSHILSNSDFPVGEISIGSSRATSLDVRGFWRVDKSRDPELRHTVLTLIAFHDLESKIQAAGGNRERGFQAFLAQNHGEGWMLPETVRLADYGLGHDDRAQHAQPVASRLGPRFYDWQLVQSTEESWHEWHLHARNLLGAQEYERLISASSDGLHDESLPLVAEQKLDYGGSKPGQKSLFPRNAR